MSETSEGGERAKVGERSLFVVGDDAQSIYGFRGSKIELILGFEKEYKGATEIVLNQNYRSVQPVLDLAEQILTLNPKQKKKDLFTDDPTNKDVFYYEAKSEKDEAHYIVRTLEKLYTSGPQAIVDSQPSSYSSPGDFFDGEIIDANTGVSADSAQETKSNDPVSSMFDVYMDDDLQIGGLNDHDPNSWSISTTDWTKVRELDNCAVLYRTHAQSRAIEEMFLKHNLPYKLVSGTRFLDRKEIKDVLSILKYISNPSDMIAFARFFPMIHEGVGPKSFQQIVAYIDDNNYELKPKLLKKYEEFCERVAKIITEQKTLIDMTKELLDRTGYLKYLRDKYPIKQDYMSRMENIAELYTLQSRFDEDEDLGLMDKLNNFLAEITLMTNQDDGEQEHGAKISLMSLHQSKGLEYDTIFLIGVEDGLLPHNNSMMEPGGIDEEVRLAYVGVTRAKKNLHVLNAGSRVMYGRVQANPASRIFRPFLKDFTKQVFY